jgi:formylglycine-generating enzyme required for sulfatase activity
MSDFNFYIANSLPDIHEFERDGGGQYPSLPSWAFLIVLGFAVVIPLLLWRVGLNKGRGKFTGESCFKLGFFILIFFTVLAGFINAIGLKGLLIITAIAIFFKFIHTLAKRWNFRLKNQSNRHISSYPNRRNQSAIFESNTPSCVQPIKIADVEMNVSGITPENDRNFEHPRLFFPKIGQRIEASFGITLCAIEPGEFYMGSKISELGRQENENVVKVVISKGFWMAKTQCTQDQWQSVMGSNPSQFIDPRNPVEQVTWEDAMQFCSILTRIQHEKGLLPIEARWTLPTEAQWEFACRAGVSTGLNSGKSISRDNGICDNLNEVAWYLGNSGGTTHHVALKKPNKWGLYDMHGNVWEWCLDWYHPNYLGGVDPYNKKQGEFRSIRGGGMGDSPWSCRSAARHPNPFPKDCDFGFRPIVCW